MRSFILSALAVLCLGAVFAAPASAVRESTDGTVTLVALSQEGDPPFSGSTRVAGEVRGDLGRGAYIGTNTFGPPGEFEGKFRAFFKKGTLKGNLSGTGTLQPDGTATFSGSGTFTGGTGRYKGAEGSFTFEGSQPPDTTSNSEPAVFEVDGTVRYKKD
jgi:hypothetical protein